MESNRVILHLQIPFCDFRRISNEATDFQPLPDWKNPIENKFFIEYFGIMEKRRKSLPQVFIDQNFYVRGRGGIKFVELEKCKLEKVKCLYKKLWKDSLAGTGYEIGLEFYGIGNKNPAVEKGEEYDLKEAIDEVLGNINVKFKHLDEKSNQHYSIINSLKPLTQLYNKATSVNKNIDDEDKIKYGNISLFFEKDNKNQICRNILYDERVELDEDIALFIKRFKFQGREVAIFILEGDFQSNFKKLREYRVRIMRMYFEYQNLRLLLYFIQNPNNKINHDSFDLYVSKKIRYFNKHKSKENAKDKVLLSLQSIFELIAPGEIENLSVNFQNIRPQIKNNLIELAKEALFEYESGQHSSIKKKIRDNLSKNDFDEVFKLLPQILKDNEVVNLESRYHALIKDNALGNITMDESEAKHNRLRSNILVLIDLDN